MSAPRRKILHSTLEPLEPRRLLAIFAPIGQQPVGGLTGKIIYTHAGHGFTSDNTGDLLWDTQRGETFEMVEDMGNKDQMDAFVNHLFAAGATIVPLRPVGYQNNEVIVDNTSPGFSIVSGTWNSGASNPYFHPSSAVPASRYRFATGNSTETAVVRFTPNIPAAGFYPVYAWALDGSNRMPDQTYRVNHSGGATEVRINHRRVGKGWVYLGTYYFNAGTGGNVEVSNKTSVTPANSTVALADAIRFGNGLGDIDRGGGASGQSREDEAGLYWIEKQAGWSWDGASTVTPVSSSNWRSSSNDGTATVGASPRYSAYMNNQADGSLQDRVFISYHSNAGGGTARGTIGLYNGNNDPGSATPNQLLLAQTLAREVNDDLVALSPQLEHSWFNRTGSNLVLDRSDIEFGEINNNVINNEFDATIIEVAFHDNQLDAELMRDPKVRNWVGRATMQGAIKYFNALNSSFPVNLPADPPTNLRAVSNASGDITVSWTAPASGGAGGAAATGYRLYSSADGYGFDGGVAIAGGGTTSYTIPFSSLPSTAVYLRVVATNAGGESLPSPVIAIRRNSAPSQAPILLVNGFDRLGRTQNFRQSVRIFGSSSSNNTPTNVIDRVRPRFSNSYDYLVQAGEAIEAYATQLGFDSVSSTAVNLGQVNLANYRVVVWLAGEQSTASVTFSPAAQSAVTSFVNGGGKLFVSGAELGWDLVNNGSGATFYNNTLKSGYVSDDAGTYSVTGLAGSIFSGLSFGFDNGSMFYDVDFPDVISAASGSTVALNYVGGTGGGAATQWAGTGGARVVNFGFPFETITTVANRASVMGRVLDFFDLVPPTVNITPVSPDPNPGPVNSISIVFSEPVTGFTLADLTLSRNGSANLLTGSQTLTSGDNITWTLGNLAPLTDVSGVFTLTLPAGAVTDLAGNPLAAGATEQFKIQTWKFRGDATGPTNDTYVFRLNNAATLVEVFENIPAGPIPSYVLALSGLPQIQVETLAGNDSVTVDFVNGSPVPAGIRQIGTSGELLRFTGAGSYTFTTNPAVDAPALDVSAESGAQVNFAASLTTLNSLSISNAGATLVAGSNRVLKTSAMSILGTGYLDLSDNDLIVDYTGSSPMNSIRGWLASGRNFAAWNGNGIRSSTAAADPNQITGLGVLESATYTSANGTNVFSGQAVDATAVLVKYTYNGDTDLNGTVDFDDYARIDTAFLGSGTGTWLEGDSDYNDLVDFDDYALIDAAFLLQGPIL
jgi:hypothetical protein